MMRPATWPLKSGKGYKDEPELAMDLVLMLAETAGSEQLVGGQMQDLLSERISEWR